MYKEHKDILIQIVKRLAGAHSPSALLTVWPGSADCHTPQLRISAALFPPAAAGPDPDHPVPAQHCSWTVSPARHGKCAFTARVPV